MRGSAVSTGCMSVLKMGMTAAISLLNLGVTTLLDDLLAQSQVEQRGEGVFLHQQLSCVLVQGICTVMMAMLMSQSG